MCTRSCSRFIGLPLHAGLQVGGGDPFWEANARQQFPNVATAVDGALKDYKSAVAELNRSTGASVSPDMDPNQLMQVPPPPRPPALAKLSSAELHRKS